MVLGSFDLFSHPFGDDRKGDDLGVRMFEGGASRCPVVLEDKDILKPSIPSQIDNPLTVGSEDILHSL
jgi:hypothetical protein